ncbi:hypothetical protein [Nocardia sp. R7R-8]|uniref:hypothetical protein n=1 Tax=Nocardia sp. R7R-8 TaxID=3459304 RepID=UPI00403E1CB7
MSASLVMILWPASVFFTAVLSFRVGRWWQSVRTENRHTVAFMRRHSDATDSTDASGDGNGDDGSWLPRPPASAPEEWMEDQACGGYSDDPQSEMEAATHPIEQVLAKGKAGRWWREDEDTAVLPRLQDIRPPLRATPIRRPPWV